MPFLSINKLTVENNNNIIVDLFHNFKQKIDIKSSLAIIGQSGSGKSLTLKTILGLCPKELKLSFDYDSDFELEFKNIGFIPQNPFSSLSSMTKIYKQFFCDENKIDKLLSLLELPSEFKYRFPSQLSGGQLQRVIIAIALSNNPKILLLDEPTTALDSKSKENIISLLIKLSKELDFIFIFVTHDIDIVKDICDNIAILKDGNIVEYGATKEILLNPSKTYTKQLLNSNFSNREYRI